MDRRRPVPQEAGDRRRVPPSQSWFLRPWKCPYPTFPFENLVIVSRQDFQYDAKTTYFRIIVNENYVFTAVFEDYFPSDEVRRNPIPAGSIALSQPQRTWTRIGITDMVKVDLYDAERDGGQALLASMDISVRFHTKSADVQVDESDLNMRFMKRNIHQILGEGQQLLIDYNSVVLRLTVVKVLSVTSGNNSQSASRTRGMISKDTVVNYLSDGDPAVPFKASNKQNKANLIIQPNFKFEEMGIGGLDNEFSTVFRRAFASRIFPRAEVEKMGITHVKGLLLHGPPGTGKTLIARQIGNMLNAREPKIVNGPEVLNKFVGQSEENIRKLFEDAEKEYKAKGPDSQLHIIIFDELDAVCRQRGSGSAGGTGVGDNIVNQLLTKLDGVEQVSNFLLIGMTNRMDLIDEALLRPGRLEVHVEISLPDEHGRVQILNIHTAKMRQNDMLAQDVNIKELASMTKNFSGAELAGLTKAASSFAMSRHVEAGTLAKVKEDLSDLKIYRQDFIQGLGEIKPVFGTSENEVGRYVEGGILNFSQSVDKILQEVAADTKGLQLGSTLLFKVLFHGLPGAGKTALAATAALESQFPFVRTLAPQELIGLSELAKVQQINKVFNDAYKSPLSVIILDCIEDIVEWTDIGMRFSNAIRLAIRAKMAQSPPPGHKVLVLVTTSELNTTKNLGLIQLFDKTIGVPYMNGWEQLRAALKLANAFGNDQERERAIRGIRHIAEDKPFSMGVKNVLKKLAISSGNDHPVDRFASMIGEEIAFSGEI